MWRLCQGFALGGEVGPTTAYLVEASPSSSRGLYGAWQGGSQNLASLVGGLVGVSLAGIAGAASLEIWGWRVAFLLGAAVLPFGVLLRRRLPETLDRPDGIDLAPGLDTLAANGRVLLLGFGLVAAMTVSTYVFNFMTTYAMTTLHMEASVSLAATAVSGSFGLAGGLLGGYLSDRIGRRPLLIWPRIFFIAVTWPAFSLIVKYHDAPTLLARPRSWHFPALSAPPRAWWRSRNLSAKRSGGWGWARSMQPLSPSRRDNPADTRGAHSLHGQSALARLVYHSLHRHRPDLGPLDEGERPWADEPSTTCSVTASLRRLQGRGHEERLQHPLHPHAHPRIG